MHILRSRALLCRTFQLYITRFCLFVFVTLQYIGAEEGAQGTLEQSLRGAYLAQS